MADFSLTAAVNKKMWQRASVITGILDSDICLYM